MKHDVNDQVTAWKCATMKIIVWEKSAESLARHLKQIKWPFLKNSTFSYVAATCSGSCAKLTSWKSQHKCQVKSLIRKPVTCTHEATFCLKNSTLHHLGKYKSKKF